MKRFDRVLKDALVNNNLVSEDQAEVYLSDARSSGMSFKDFLLHQEILTDSQITIALSQQLNLEVINFKKVKVSKEVLDKIPVKFVWYYKFMPVEIKNNVLTIVSAIPFDVKGLDEIRLNLKMKINPCLTTESELIGALKKYYGLASDMIDKIMSSSGQGTTSQVESIASSIVEDIEQKTDDPTVSHLVNEIILEAYNKRATDIHVEPYRNKVRFRYRIDGVLVDANLPANVRVFLPQILSRIKILANLSITEKRMPQDGSAVVKAKDQQLDLRVSTLPTPRGESLVIRLLPSTFMLYSLEKLGFSSYGVGKFQELIKKPHGIIFITGPTGSGKTTTLYACLNEINSPKRKIITIEDPVEYEMEGVTQIQVNNKINFDFSAGLRSVLRHDPDILMVGEVRDLETAEIAIRTALTGHLVFSTLHTNDAASGVSRLIDMGVEPYMVVSSVAAFVAQRLVRTICPKCKEEADDVPSAIKEEVRRSLKLSSDDPVKMYRGKGCEKCNSTGYYGRMAIFEILEIKDEIRSAILEKARADQLKAMAIENGMVTLRTCGWQSVVDGLTTPDEILNVTVRDEHDGQLYEIVEDKIKTTEPSYEKGIFSEKQAVAWRVKRQASWENQNLYDARIYPRIPSPIEVRYQILSKNPEDPRYLISNGVEYTTYTEDISAGGLRFLAKDILPLDTLLGLQIQLPDSKKRISCLAKICRLEEDSREHIFAVVNYYLDLTSSDRAAISRFVKHEIDLRQN